MGALHSQQLSPVAESNDIQKKAPAGVVLWKDNTEC